MDYALYGKRYDKKKCRLHTNICDNKLNGPFDITALRACTSVNETKRN